VRLFIFNTTRILVTWQRFYPWENVKNHGKRIFDRDFARGEFPGNTPRRKLFARGFTPVKFPRVLPLSNLPGAYPCQINLTDYNNDGTLLCNLTIFSFLLQYYYYYYFVLWSWKTDLRFLSPPLLHHHQTLTLFFHHHCFQVHKLQQSRSGLIIITVLFASVTWVSCKSRSNIQVWFSLLQKK
jgi:hypothetical protein